jgi:nucleoside-diphosphate-sugar epimerase
VRTYALTYPQLVRQATAAGWSSGDLRRLRSAYDVAHRLFDGIYRSGGHPLVCHTVRTASIVLAEGQAPDLVVVALVHAAYERHRYDGTSRDRPGRRLRAQLQREIGATDEALVWRYHLLDRSDWGGRPDAYRHLLDEQPDVMRPVLVLRVANELEDHLDLGRAHRDAPYRDRVAEFGPAMVELARVLDLPVLADELEVAYAEHLDHDVPPAARWNRRRAYELPGRRRSAVAVRRRVRRLGRVARRVRPARGRPPSSAPEPVTAPGTARPLILVTGAAGRVGQAIVPLLRPHHALRLLDLRPVAGQGDDDVVRADIRDLDAVRAACAGVDAVVHLAAQAWAAEAADLVAHNVDGTAQVFEAARLAGVGRVVFASSGQVVGGYPPDQWVTADLPVRPINLYACTKVFGEGLARHYADRYGMSVICLRIGWFAPEDEAGRVGRADLARRWCSPADLAQLIVKAIAADAAFGVYFAVSDNEARNWDLEDARRDLGYTPADPAPRPAAAPAGSEEGPVSTSH